MLKPIVRRANQLRRALRLSVGTVGISFLLFAALGFFIVSYTLDFFLPDHLDFFQRALVLLLGLGGVAFLAVRYTVLPLRGRYSVDSLVLAIEKAYPQLNDELISSLQLDRRLSAGDTSMSHMMARLVIDDGLARVRDINPIAPIDRTRVNLFGGGGLLCVFLLGVAFAVPPMHTWIWFGRNVLLQPWQYPQRTSLSLYRNLGGELWEEVPEGGTISIARGENLSLEIRADATRHVPDRTYIRYEFDGGNRGELAKGPMGSDANASRYRFSFSKVPESLRLTIRGGDYHPPEGRDWWRVRVLEPPQISAVRLECRFPPYTRKLDKVFDSQRSGAQLGSLRLPVGTKIKLTAQTTKPIVQAKVVSLTREDVVGGRMGEAMQTLEEPASEFSEELILIKGGELFIELWDFEGVQNQLAVQLKITAVPDEDPSISARITGVSQMVTPQATVPLELLIDDDYGTRAAAIAAESSGRKKPYDLAEITQLLDARGQTVPFGPAKVKGIYRWDIALLDTKPGDFLTFKVQATDNEVLMPNPVPVDPPSGGGEPAPRLPILDGANVGDSETISLKIVSPEELTSELIARQIEIHQEFVALLEQQKEYRLQTITLKGKLASQGAVSGTLATDLKDARLGQEKVPDELIRSADRLLDIAAEMVNNRIDQKDELTVLRKLLAEPIKALAESHATGAGKGLKDAEDTADASQRDGMLNQVIALQNLTVTEMTRLAELMKQKATLDEIRQLAIAAKIGQEDIRRITRVHYENWLKELIGPKDDGEPRID